MRRWLDSYARRFTPSLLLKLARCDPALLPRSVAVDERGLEEQLRECVEGLETTLPGVDFHGGVQAEERQRATDLLYSRMGFVLTRKESVIAGAGRGVFVEKGEIPCGSLVALYPGTLYQPGQPILLPSLGNEYILRCADGVSVDGRDRGLSRIIHRSSVYRDLSPRISDISWMTDAPVSFLNIGQYVNNSPKSGAQNVQYVDLNIQGWPFSLRRWLPFIPSSPCALPSLRMVRLGSRGLMCARDIVATAALRGQEQLVQQIQRSYSMSDVGREEPRKRAEVTGIVEMDEPGSDDERRGGGRARSMGYPAAAAGDSRAESENRDIRRSSRSRSRSRQSTYGDDSIGEYHSATMPLRRNPRRY